MHAYAPVNAWHSRRKPNGSPAEQAINASVNAQSSPNARNVKQPKIFRLLCEITVIKPPKFWTLCSGFRAVHASIIHHRYIIYIYIYTYPDSRSTGHRVEVCRDPADYSFSFRVLSFRIGSCGHGYPNNVWIIHSSGFVNKEEDK